MKPIKTLTISIFFLLLTGCGSTLLNVDMQVIPINFQALEYNSATNQYTPRLTRVDYNSASESKALRFHVDDYSPQGKYFSIMEDDFDIAIDAVNKFLRWEKIAVKDGDILNKHISSGKYCRMEFHSGNASSHYFVIGTKLNSLVGETILSPLYFDVENAIKFRDFLVSHKAGKTKSVDKSKYN